MEVQKEIMLKVNLEKYGEALVEGVLGWTIPNTKLSMWGSQDRFVAVKFDNGASLDLLWKNLEQIQPNTEHSPIPPTHEKLSDGSTNTEKPN